MAITTQLGPEGTRDSVSWNQRWHLGAQHDRLILALGSGERGEAEGRLPDWYRLFFWGWHPAGAGSGLAIDLYFGSDWWGGPGELWVPHRQHSHLAGPSVVYDAEEGAMGAMRLTVEGTAGGLFVARCSTALVWRVERAA